MPLEALEVSVPVLARIFRTRYSPAQLFALAGAIAHVPQQIVEIITGAFQHAEVVLASIWFRGRFPAEEVREDGSLLLAQVAPAFPAATYYR
jgi:hypothetical protein